MAEIFRKKVNLGAIDLEFIAEIVKVPTNNGTVYVGFAGVDVYHRGKLLCSPSESVAKSSNPEIVRLALNQSFVTYCQEVFRDE